MVNLPVTTSPRLRRNLHRNRMCAMSIIIVAGLIALLQFFWPQFLSTMEEIPQGKSPALTFMSHGTKRLNQQNQKPKQQQELGNSSVINIYRHPSFDPKSFYHPSSSSYQIPHIMVFTHKTNLLGPKAVRKDLRFFSNILHTINMYKKAWNHTGSSSDLPRVWFLDDDECKNAIALVEPKLVEHFINEQDGSYKGDLCRAAALFLSGGYYFDVDMLVIQPVLLKNSTKFSSSITTSSMDVFFNSFVAASPQNQIIYDSIQVMLRYYEQKQNFITSASMNRFNCEKILAAMDDPFLSSEVCNMWKEGFIGPYSLKAAFDYHVSDDIEGSDEDASSSEIFVEDNFNHLDKQQSWFPYLEYQVGVGCCCNWIVHNQETRQPYFFSRIVGARETCDFREKSTSIVNSNQNAAEPRVLQANNDAWIDSWKHRQRRLPSDIEYFHLS